ncbi:acyl-CoA dehydrogenase family protein, partial [Microvirga sp. 3-52]|nr:acyl-CoA dehydrogenase family protein [Microvirga sp. 3-52]
VPEKYNDSPLTINKQKIYGVNLLERVIALEILAYGDVGVLLASPGPSLSGQVIMDLGNDEQQERYYSTILKDDRWTFFAMSEPTKGSDASNIKTNLSKKGDYYVLNGEKKYIGNGTRGKIGVVFVKSSDGPLGISSILMKSNKKGFNALPLETLGLKAAGLSHLHFNEVVIEPKDLLGSHLSPTRRGLWGAIQTFNRMRPGVAALGLGIAQATLDYILDNRSNYTLDENKVIEQYKDDIKMVRALIRTAAVQLEKDPSNGYMASMAKIKAIELVEGITEYALYLFAPHALLTHPFLNKWFRDARGLEFMEGTSNIQKLNVFQSYYNGKISYV